MKAKFSDRLRLLSLDGGGIRGLSSIMILKDIMRGLNRGRAPNEHLQPWQAFDLIGGTSTGGLLAVMLGRLRMSVDECEEAYLKMSDRIFNHKRSAFNAFGKGKDFYQVKGRFDTGELKASVLEVLHEKNMMEPNLFQEPGSTCKVFVCAVLTSNSRACLLRSYENPEAGELLYDTCKIWEACLATTAATTFFDSVAIGPYGQIFADGAVAYNNPIQLVYREAEMLWPGRAGNATLVSIGTGGAVPRALEGSMIQVIDALKQIVVQTESTADDFSSDHRVMADSQQLFRFNVTHGLSEIGLEEAKEKRKIADATHTYLNTPEIRQRQRICVQRLSNNADMRLNLLDSLESSSSSLPLEKESIDSLGDLLVFEELSTDAPRYSTLSFQQKLPQAHITNSSVTTFDSKPSGLSGLPGKQQQDTRKSSPSDDCESQHLDSPATTISPTFIDASDVLLRDIQQDKATRITKHLLEGVQMGDSSQVNHALVFGAGLELDLDTALFLAIKMRRLNLVERLILSGARTDVFDSSEANVLGYNGMSAAPNLTNREQRMTALQCEINSSTRSIDVVKLLLANGADVSASSKPDSLTALHMAIATKEAWLVSLILGAGADVNAETAVKLTPVHYAAYVESAEITQLLLDRSPSLDAKCLFFTTKQDRYNLRTPLIFAARTDTPHCLELLLKAGADPNTKAQTGWTALHSASCWIVESVELLLEAGADPNTKDTSGMSPLHSAAHWGRTEVIELLLASGAKIEEKDDSGRTALHHAAEAGHDEALILLLYHNANFNLKTDSGLTPLDLAKSKQGSSAVVAILRHWRKYGRLPRY